MSHYLLKGFLLLITTITTITSTTTSTIFETFLTTVYIMESIEEQQALPNPPDIISDLQTDINSAKKAVKIWILDWGELQKPLNTSNQSRLQLYCLLSTYSFYIRVAQQKDGLYSIISYRPYDCPPSIYAKFKPRNSAWYLASLIERDITINRNIKPKEIRERARIYYQLPNIQYKPAQRARERLQDQIDGNEGASFQLIPDQVNRVLESDDTGSFIDIEQQSLNNQNRFEAIFMMLGSTQSVLYLVSTIILIELIESTESSWLIQSIQLIRSIRLI